MVRSFVIELVGGGVGGVGGGFGVLWGWFWEEIVVEGGKVVTELIVFGGFEGFVYLGFVIEKKVFLGGGKLVMDRFCFSGVGGGGGG